MATPMSTPANRGSARWLAAGVLVLGLAGALVSYYWPDSEPPVPSAPPESAPLPPLSGSPFLNTKPGVAYVGDQGCVDCHRTYCDSYHRHPMGRSMFQAANSKLSQPKEDRETGAFQAGPLRFEAIRRGEKLIHRESCRDLAGKTIAEFEAEIDYVVGSGTQARSYLYRRGGFLFQSPITWYSRKSEVQLSPGYEKTQQHFSRRIDSRCLYCHCQEARPVADTVNRYREPPFGQLAIGCERCHGPGELHVAARRKSIEPDDVDYNIVNPRRLSPALREAVCEQCHLQGEAVIPRRGRSQTDYRPGLPLHEYVSVFVRSSEASDSKLIVGHVEQMHQSACYKKSVGKFGCISCHDPHKQPTEPEKAAFYKQRCLNCHAEPPRAKPAETAVNAPVCSAPLAQRLAKDPSDNCMTCHMPRNPSSSATHLAVTDHRVLRAGDRTDQMPPGQKGELPLVPFHRGMLDPKQEEAPRDLGLALISLAAIAHDVGSAPIRDYLCRKSLPLLHEAAVRDPTDVPVLEARGFALLALGQSDEALKAMRSALAMAPIREQALSWAVLAADAASRSDLAEEYARRLVENYPHFAGHHLQLAIALTKRKAWPQALEAANAAMSADPFRVEARALIITIHLETGRPKRALAEFDAIGVLDPEYQKRIRPWFEERVRSSK